MNTVSVKVWRKAMRSAFWDGAKANPPEPNFMKGSIVEDATPPEL